MRGEADCGDADHRKLATKIDRAGRRMHGLIEDILDLVRGRFAVGIPLSAQATNLVDLCRAVIDESRLARPERPMTLDASGDVNGCWDAGKLGRVVSNLIGNAVDHSPHGTIHVRVSDRGDQVALEVHNQGEPIDPQVLPVLFEPFRRGETSHNGLGLGLHIVREIVRAHRGSVDVRSTAADGTTFVVMLPRGTQRPEPANSDVRPQLPSP
jgi:signal transduction histidine kinase